MMLSSGDPRENPALESLAELARGDAQLPTSRQLDRGWQAVSNRLAAASRRRRAFFRWSVFAVAATASVLGILQTLALVRARSSALPALAYRIEGGSVVEGGYLRESGHASIKLLFNEGTEFDLMPGTRARLRTVDRSGARIAIEQGTASFRVTPRSGRKWLVDVGPFLVTVRGTVFTVSWDAANERFELRLRRGHVTVSGPVSGGEIALRAGQRLVVNVPKSEALITDRNPDEPWSQAVPGPTAPPAQAGKQAGLSVPGGPTGATLGTATPARPHAKPDRAHRWAEALATGRWNQILADAERAGIQATLDQASSEELFELANAARYRRRMDLAQAALLAERERFPGSARALDALYLLGRVAETSGGGTSKALQWYDEYLARAPRGTYASEAMGRKMTLTNKLEGVAQARPIAEEYLRRFPNGSYAGSARALRRAP